MNNEANYHSSDWIQKKVDDIVDVIRGTSWKHGEISKDGVAVLTIPNIQDGRINYSTDVHLKKHISSDKRLKKGDTVAVASSGSVKNIGRSALVDKDLNAEYTVASFLLIMRSRGEINSSYLYYLSKSDSLKLSNYGRRAADGKFNFQVSEFRNAVLPVPSKFEQEKIAFILTKLQQTIEQQEKIIEKTKELKRSLMHRLFTYGLWGEELKETEIGLMPESWSAKPFESLCENVKDSWNPGQYLNGIYVGLEHIESGNSVLKSFGTAQNLRSSKFIFSEGDILYGKLRPYLDKAVITNKKGICSTDILVFRPKNNVPAGFIVNLIHWSPFIEYAKKTTHGVNHPRTSWNSIRNFTCGIPQYEEQKEIASILSSIDEKIERERQRKYQFRALFKSMLQLLMTGQVRVKDIDFGEINV